ncbi:protein-disulfide reductase DsbD family protein [Jannaschia sp. LMIT008]|uniref:protein-disulfide reductase DsbD family protein n=1 Tax=Jannaschia maritima TaxID=3032585 RepID=UPI00281123CD|nr:protein-disulfide reductase DsbD domain-containing protein [Jannaschia sp. LMIT008]
MLRLLALLVLLAAPIHAAQSPVVQGTAVDARLIAARDGVTGRTLSAGLDLTLKPGWKTYWRSPGEVGLPPRIDWSASRNVAEVTLAYPAPARFTAFEIENYGYADEVVFPLSVALVEPDAPARLAVTATMLVCADICIPETVDLSLDLPAGGGLDAAMADRLGEWVARVPDADGFDVAAVHLDGDALTLTATSDRPLADPQVFPEHGDYAAFGAPEVRIAGDGRTLWARLPVLNPGEGPLDLTLVDGTHHATLADLPLAAAPPPAPGPAAPDRALGGALLAALLGGLILNVMPCVLPVLSIKLASALQARDRGPTRIRLGFLAAAGGILCFFAALAGLVIALRAGGVAVGWGMQFQQPAFLAALAVVMTLFAANLLGWFELSLPSRVQTAMGGSRGGDFATGAFAALMATPCSAPFLGSAVAFALTQDWPRTLAVFLAMGLGLALPYLLVAAAPRLVHALPRPGRWMGAVRGVLGCLMLVAAAWVVSVIWSGTGPVPALAVAGLALLALAALRLRPAPGRIGAAALVAAIAAALVLPSGPQAAPTPSGIWLPFDRAALTDRVAAGEVVFVDVTADWCLTCKVNKRAVLDAEPVAGALAGVAAMQADWTRPDPAIAAYLAGWDRYGIPFNAVYGPGAPDGIPLPEILTDAIVLDALARAGG